MLRYSMQAQASIERRIASKQIVPMVLSAIVQ